MCYARCDRGPISVGPLSQLDNMEIWSGKRESGQRIVLAPDFEVVGCHNQNQILVFMRPGFWYVHVVEWCPLYSNRPTSYSSIANTKRITFPLGPQSDLRPSRCFAFSRLVWSGSGSGLELWVAGAWTFSPGSTRRETAPLTHSLTHSGKSGVFWLPVRSPAPDIVADIKSWRQAPENASKHISKLFCWLNHIRWRFLNFTHTKFVANNGNLQRFLRQEVVTFFTLVYFVRMTSDLGRLPDWTSKSKVQGVKEITWNTIECSTAANILKPDALFNWHVGIRKE